MTNVFLAVLCNYIIGLEFVVERLVVQLSNPQMGCLMSTKFSIAITLGVHAPHS